MVAEQLVRPGFDWSIFFFPRSQLPLQEMSHYSGTPAQQQRFRQTGQWGGGGSGGSCPPNDDVMGCGGHDVMVPKSMLTRCRVFEQNLNRQLFAPVSEVLAARLLFREKNASVTAKSLVIKEAQTGSNLLVILQKFCLTDAKINRTSKHFKYKPC